MDVRFWRSAYMESNRRAGEAITSLAARASKGDDKAFAELCELKLQEIVYTIVKILGRYEGSEDIAQEVLIKAHQGIGRLREPKYFNTWLYRIIVNECKMFFRKNARAGLARQLEELEDKIAVDEPEFLPERALENEEDKEALMRAIGKLSPKNRQVLTLFYFGGLSYAEIAEATGLSIKSIDNSLSYSKKSIRKQMERKGVFLADMKGILPAPVITRALKENADKIYPQELQKQFLEARMETILKNGSVGAGETTAKPARKAGRVSALAACVAAVAIMGVLIPLNSANEDVVDGGLKEVEAKNSITIEDGEAPLAGVETIEETVGAAPKGAGIDSLAQNPAAAASTSALNGKVWLRSETGGVVEDAAALAGLVVVLKNENGEELANAKTDAQGNFSFGARPEEGVLTLELDIEGGGYVYGAENPDGTIGITNEMEKAEFFVEMQAAPIATEIVFEGGQCGCGHANPKLAKVAIDGEGILNSWEIKDSDGNILYGGSSPGILGELAELLEGGRDGTYTIYWEVAHENGSSALLARKFVIDSLEIGENEYE